MLTGVWQLNSNKYLVQINSQLIKNQGQKIHLPIGLDSQPACFFGDQWYTIRKSEIYNLKF